MRKVIRVTTSEEEVVAIIQKATDSFMTNTTGPGSYLKIYDSYLYILSGEAEKSLDKFFKSEPFPLLKVSTCTYKHNLFTVC